MFVFTPVLLQTEDHFYTIIPTGETLYSRMGLHFKANAKVATVAGEGRGNEFHGFFLFYQQQEELMTFSPEWMMVVLKLHCHLKTMKFFWALDRPILDFSLTTISEFKLPLATATWRRDEPLGISASSALATPGRGSLEETSTPGSLGGLLALRVFAVGA